MDLMMRRRLRAWRRVVIRVALRPARDTLRDVDPTVADFILSLIFAPFLSEANMAACAKDAYTMVVKARPFFARSSKLRYQLLTEAGQKMADL